MYPADSVREQVNPSLDPVSDRSSSGEDETTTFGTSPNVPLGLMPAVITSSGQLSAVDLKYLHYYRANVWSAMSLQKTEQVTFINRDWVPQTSLGSEHMLFSMLSISAMHLHGSSQNTTPDQESLALRYRQKAFASYNNALQNITAENYESLLITSMWMMVMVSSPTLPCTDEVCLSWASSLFTMMQGLRILASLKWASGIEKLTTYPLFRRELKKLPPPPMLTSLPDWIFYASGRSQGDDWHHPNAPEDPYLNESHIATDSTSRPRSISAFPPSPQSAGVTIDTSKLGFRPQQLMSASNSPHAPPSWKSRKSGWALPAPAFLPPPLMALLQRLVDPMQTGPLDLHRPVLIPVFHALSPIFLSLYYYRLSSDIHVRIFVLPTFLTADFLALVRAHEPRALVLVGWWFALLTLLPQTNKWFPPEVIARVLQSVSNIVMRTCDTILMNAMKGAYRIVTEAQRVGKEAAARTIFEGWHGVIWEEGPKREEEWRLKEQWHLHECDS